jgi:hypothetical protein
VRILHWLGAGITLLSSALLAVSSWPAPRYVDDYLDCPKQIRLGDVDTMTLSVAPDFSSEVSTVAVAHVQAADLHITPPGDVLQAARPGQPAHWRWQVAAGSRPGRREITLIIYLRPVHDPAQDKIDQPVWARSVTITVTDVFGMPAATARAIALAGAAAGFGLSLLPVAWRILLRPSQNNDS